MRGLLFFIILVIAVILIRCGSSKSSASKISEYSNTSLLVEYGEYVYQREDCKKCHTQLILEASSELISLDHYGGYRKPAWTYLFLYEPRFMIPGCNMPSYKHLKDNKLDKAILKQILSNRKVSKRAIENYWNQLNQLTVDYTDEFKDDLEAEVLETSELISLVAYLQQIPRSSEKRAIDSLKNIQYQKEMEALDLLYEKSDSIIASVLKDPKSIEVGKELFSVNCAVCHGEKAQGHVGPNLTDEYWIYGGDKKSIIETITSGRTYGMPSHKHKFTPHQIGQVAAYVISLSGSNPENPKAPEGEKAK